jgi:hypothetical protein
MRQVRLTVRLSREEELLLDSLCNHFLRNRSDTIRFLILKKAQELSSLKGLGILEDTFGVSDLEVLVSDASKQ